MFKDIKFFLWLLKLGALVNIYLLGVSISAMLSPSSVRIVLPAMVVFGVGAFRCLFPVRYKDNIVFHDSRLSSIFLTRFLATFSEVSLIYLLAHMLQLFNTAKVGWVTALSSWMVVQVIVSQVFVWSLILTGRLMLFFYEELGWFLIYAINTLLSLYLFMSQANPGGRTFLLQINMLFGAFYLPWQLFHLRDLRRSALSQGGSQASVTMRVLKKGLHQSVCVKNQTTASLAWGGLIGVMWMTGYWATLIPWWVYQIVRYGV